MKAACHPIIMFADEGAAPRPTPPLFKAAQADAKRDPTLLEGERTSHEAPFLDVPLVLACQKFATKGVLRLPTTPRIF